MKIQREYIGNYSYEVGINSVADYSPFGVELDGRTIENIFHHPSQNNGSQTQADTVEIYNNDFDNPPATGSPYLSTEVTLDAHLSNTTWTSSTGAFTNYNSSGAGSGKSIAITTASADTAYLTLTMDVDSGYELDITSYSFAHRSSATGYDSYTLIVNGVEIGSGSIYVASSGSTLQSTGVVDVSNPISGQTGTVGVVLKLYGGTHGHSGTFRMDDFVLNGFVREENSGYSSSDYFVSRNHRYSFQNQEKHDEVRGKGNYINYKYRGHDPRIGRLDWLVDPLSADYPWNSPYAFSENRVLDGVELEGLEYKEIDNFGNTNIFTTISIVTKGEGAISNTSEIISYLKAAEIQYNLNSTMKNYFSIFTSPIIEGKIKIKAQEDKYVKFNFTIIEAGDYRDATRKKYGEDGFTDLGVVLKMGNEGDFEDNVMAKYVGNAIELNPKYYSPEGEFYNDISKVKFINNLIHEIGHDLGLEHLDPKTNLPSNEISAYPDKGFMAPAGDEYNKIEDTELNTIQETVKEKQ